MNLTDEQLARFETAAEGQLSPEERQRFKAELTTDNDLRAEWTAYCQLRHSLESITIKRQLVAMHAQLAAEGHLDANDGEGTETLIRPLPTSRRSGWWWGVAAGVMLAIGIAWWSSSEHVPDTQTLYAEHYRPEGIIRGQNDCGPWVGTSVEQYRKGHYEAALQQLANVPSANACTNYYRGLCQLALYHPEAAVSALQEAQKQSSGTLQQRADWYLAMAYLATDEAGKARHELTAIIAQPSHPFKAVAENVLAKL